MADETYREIPLSDLRLDPENPRLPRDLEPSERTQERLLKEFARRYNLVELARSIADKGFLPRYPEAVLAVEEPPASQVFVVVEGNRRLATLRLLTNEADRKACGLGAEWEQLAEDSVRHELTADVPVIVYRDRSALDDYLGFRHITGPRPWRPEAKGRFIARLLGSGEGIDKTARRIGSNRRTVRRYAEAYAVFTQAADLGIDIEAVEAGFGVFYNALSSAGVRDFLGLGRQLEIDALPVDPVPKQHAQALTDLIALLFGDEDKKLAAVIRESRDLGKLSEVLLDSAARSNLLRDRDLDRAWRTAGGGKADLIGLLRDLYLRLAEVNGQALEYSDDDEIRDEVRRVQLIVTDMAKRYNVEED